MECIQINLPSSKSIHNRLQIIHALSGIKNSIRHPSDAKDARELAACLESNEQDINIGNGGTSLRFILPYLCLKQELKKLDCGESLKRRPIKPLLLALEKMGCLFTFYDAPYKLPLKINKGIDPNFSGLVEMDMKQSSQFVSALALIAPAMNHGLKLMIGKEQVSESYLHMTLSLMAKHGVKYQRTEEMLIINPASYKITIDEVEADWSSAVVFISWIALHENFSLYFPGLKKSGLQGDEKILDFINNFGVDHEEYNDGILFTKKTSVKIPFIELDLKDCPDLFPVLALLCALNKTNVRFLHVQNLQHKESDRLKVITDFLTNCNITHELKTVDPSNWTIEYRTEKFRVSPGQELKTYDDHRIAMAFSLLTVDHDIHIMEKEVVEKSFPAFWQEFAKLKKVQP